MSRKKRGWILAGLVLLLFALDGITKYWVQSHLMNTQYGPPFYPYGGIGVFRDILGIDFSISLVYNQGGAWGVFNTFPKALLFIRIGIVALIAYYMFLKNKIPRRTLPFLLILVGAVANILDHFIYGAVVDMFHFVLWGYSFPVFNIADMLIFFGVVLFLIQTIRRKSIDETQPSES